MKRRLLNTICALILCLLGAGVQAQKAKVKAASENFDEYAYVDARNLYLRAVARGSTSQEVLQKLGDSYYFTADYREAAKWYGELVDGSTSSGNVELDAEYYFRYAQSLKSMKRYALADEQMRKFLAVNGADSRAEMFDRERDYLKEIEAQSGRYSVEKVNFNSDLQDFAPSFYGDRLVFSSNRESRTGDYIHDWNEQPFLDLFVVDSPRGEAPVISKFSKEMNTPYHESTSVFNENGDVIYFTRNNYSKKFKGKKLKKSENGATKLKIFRSYRDGDDWSTPEELPFNSDEFSTAHPALSADGSTLYFASDRPGTKGLSDIWKVAVYPSGDFGEPVNLGDKINTPGRETFPFISNDNELFYATDGHLGLGGLDIFSTQLDASGNVGDSYNVGKPVNSSADDFGLILNSNDNRGYFSSNRDTGLGNDDIYSFTREKQEPIVCVQTITGVTKDVKTEAILPQATVELRNIDNEVVATKTSDAAGRYSFADIDCSTSYIVRASKVAYDPAEVVVKTTSEVDGVLSSELLLKPQLQLNVGDDLAKTLALNPIYFDFDKDNIRPDAALELEKVIAVMKEYPTLKIDVRSHTDSRGRDSYNLSLSERRNRSTKNYIINQGGISRDRITGRGYGETSPVNGCTNGIKCSDDQHELNRRSEFIIVSK